MNTKEKAAVASGGPAKLSYVSLYQEGSTARTHSPLLPASRTRACPACGGTDWCSIAADGSLCICMRLESGSVKPTRNGGFLHLLGGDIADARPGAGRFGPCEQSTPVAAQQGTATSRS